MVVLDKSEMLTIGNNQYLQPDYLAPSNSVVGVKNYYFDNFQKKKKNINNFFLKNKKNKVKINK